MAIDSLSAEVKNVEMLIKASKFNDALGRISDIYFQLGLQLECQGNSLNSPKFDQLCQEIGAKSGHALLGETCEPINEVHDVILITEITCHGGHGEIVKDIAALNDVPVVIVATNMHARAKPVLPKYLTMPNILKVEECVKKTMLERLQAVQQYIARPSVRRVFMLHHGYDAVANAAATHDLPSPIYFLHHCDSAPALGCHLDNVAHIDLHNIAFHRCRYDSGIADNHYLGMTSRPGPRRAPARFAAPFFKTASCGGEHKLSRLPYPFGYSDMVLTLLKVGDGRHYHIGPLSDTFVSDLRNKLRASDIDSSRFIHIESAPYLANILHHLEVDLYLPTLPQGGGKAMVDAMSVGVPLVVHENGIDRLWGGRDLAYPEAPSWRTLSDLEAVIANFDEAMWLRQIGAVRRHFDRYHAPEVFAEALRMTGTQADMPPLKPHRPDPEIRLRFGLLNGKASASVMGR